jgi:hypothetical protein
MCDSSRKKDFGLSVLSIAGHVSRKMMEHYSHIRMEAKRLASADNDHSIRTGSEQPKGELTWAC